MRSKYRYKHLALAISMAIVLNAMSGIALAHEGYTKAQVTQNCSKLANEWYRTLKKAKRAIAKYNLYEMGETEPLFRQEIEKRRKWSYLHSNFAYNRHEGVAFHDMTARQRILAHKFIRCGLSSQGYSKVANIFVGEKEGWEQLLDEGIRYAVNDKTLLAGAGSYWLAIFGEPSDTAPWQWQLEGHHLSINMTMAGDQISVSPTFLGTRPTVIDHGQYAGWHLAGYEKDRAFRLMKSLEDQQLDQAVLGDKVVANIFTDPARLDVFDSYAGLSAADMNTAQQNLLWDLIKEYVNDYEYAIAEDLLAEVEIEGIENIHFAWIGLTKDLEDPIYFRVHGPSIIIEFVNAVNHGGNTGGVPIDENYQVIESDEHIPDSNHVHSIYRRPGGDFGDDIDVLREHYLNDPAHSPE